MTHTSKLMLQNILLEQNKGKNPGPVLCTYCNEEHAFEELMPIKSMELQLCNAPLPEYNAPTLTVYQASYIEYTVVANIVCQCKSCSWNFSTQLNLGVKRNPPTKTGRIAVDTSITDSLYTNNDIQWTSASSTNYDTPTVHFGTIPTGPDGDEFVTSGYLQVEQDITNAVIDTLRADLDAAHVEIARLRADIDEMV